MSPVVRPKGFTLIELLVVMVIIGVMVAAASLSIPRKNSDPLAEEGRRLDALMKLAKDEAIFQSTTVGVLFEEKGYRFLQLSEGNAWVELKDKVLRPRQLPEVMKLSLELEGELIVFEEKEKNERLIPQVFVFSTGEVSPFAVLLSGERLEEKLFEFDGFGVLKRPDE